MKIDFDRTEVQLSKLVEESVLRLTTESPHTAIKRLGLWGLAFPAIAKVLVDAEDNGQNLGQDSAGYEYVENEYGGGIYFDWWPDLYALEEGDNYEIAFKEDWEVDPALLVGDDAINIPLFALFMNVLDSASLDKLKLADGFSLSAAIGAHWLDITWSPGELPDISTTIAHVANEFQAREAGLRPAIPTTHDTLKHKISTLNTGRRGTINSVAFSSDDKTLISYGSNGILEVWDAQSGKLVWGSNETEHHSMAYSAESGLAVTFGLEENMALWNVPERSINQELKGHEDWVCSAALFKGLYLASADDNGAIRLWNQPFGENNTVIAEGLRIIGQLAFSPDGKSLAHVSNNGDESVTLYDLATGSSTPISAEHDPWPSTVAFSPDRTFLATGSSERLNLWNLHEKREQHSFVLDSSIAKAIAFSPDSSILIGAGQDRAIVFWDVETGHRRLTIANPLKHATVRCLAFTSDGRILASSNSDGTIDLWDMNSICAD